MVPEKPFERTFGATQDGEPEHIIETAAVDPDGHDFGLGEELVERQAIELGPEPIIGTPPAIRPETRLGHTVRRGPPGRLPI